MNRSIKTLLYILVSLTTFFVNTTWSQESPKSHYFTASDGVKIHYLTLGDKGSYVVLVHGFRSSAEGNWFRQGIPQVLAQSHRVIAIDNRNHGESDKPNDGEGGIARDTIELFDHLKIEKAHLHGYSMGGNITGHVLAVMPERLITASFGGSGIREIPEGEPTSPPDKNMDWDTALSQRVQRLTAIDLSKVAIPVMAINGSEDNPYEKTVRMTRELRDFTNFILPGFGHMNAMRPGTQYAEHLAHFINSHDSK